MSWNNDGRITGGCRFSTCQDLEQDLEQDFQDFQD